MREGHGVSARVLVADLSKDAGIGAVASSIESDSGIAVLVNDAGFSGTALGGPLTSALSSPGTLGSSGLPTTVLGVVARVLLVIRRSPRAERFGPIRNREAPIGEPRLA